MPQGDPGGHFASSGGYGSNFGGAGGAAGNVGGAEHGMLGFGGMSPGGYDSDTYAANLAGLGGVPGFGARVTEARAARQRALQQAAARASRKGKGKGFGAGVTAPGVVAPAPTEQPPVPSETVPTPPLNVQSGAFFPGTSAGVSPPAPGWESAFPNGNFIAPTRQEWSSPSPGSGLGFGGPENWNNANSTHIGRQFGGPVAPGGQYTVGENGPETLQMGAQGGQVIPNNPVDRLGGMNPQTMQALLQLMQQQRRPQMNPGQTPVGQPAPRPIPQPPQMQPPMGQSPGGGGGFRLGDWRNRMGIEGLSRPPSSMGFGGSSLGIPGVMGQMRSRMG